MVSRKGRGSEFEDPHDVIPVEGLVFIEDLVDRHSVGEILEQNFDQGHACPEKRDGRPSLPGRK
jgi:hypothetical protein